MAKAKIPVRKSICTHVEKKWNKKTQLQDQFITPHGICYSFYVQMEDGCRGKFNSMSEYQDKFVVGKECFFTYELKTSGKFPERIIKPHTPVTEKTLNANINNKSKNNNKEKPMTPKEIKQLCKNINVGNAVKAYIALIKIPTSKEMVASMAEKFTKWCVSVTPITREIVEARANNITNALDCMIHFKKDDKNVFPLRPDKTGIDTSDEIIELAEYFYTYSTTE